ncbi:MAG: methyltransferase domain-containing protein [Bryobacterales bacterium]|nr:methyltransferase domain-containing protein [Bryobacteraceae bacterium]MDW8354362.1 methyltransferase domain-containing protein [Bryobacterales bacterium]
MARLTTAARVQRKEALDEEVLDAAELRGNLRDLEQFNRWFGGTNAVLDELSRLTRDLQPGARLRILDAGTGGADIARAIVGWAARSGYRVQVVACDRHPQVAAAAREFCAGFSEIEVVETDVLEARWPDGFFDFAVCALTLHHLDDGEALTLLRRLAEATRGGVIVSDLERSALAVAGVWLATRLLSRNRMTRHDGPLSVRRAFRPHELVRLGERAGLRVERCYRRPFFRIVAVFARAESVWRT